MKDTCSCRNLTHSLNAYIDGELSASQILSLDEHIESCQQCAGLVAFARTSRRSVQVAVQEIKAPPELRVRVAQSIQQESHGLLTEDRLLSWRIAGPLAAAACIALVWAAVSYRSPERVATNRTPEPPRSTASASMVPIDALLDTFIDQHIDPPPPEATDPSQLAAFDRFVGVPVRKISLRNYKGEFIGTRMVPIQRQHTAMYQYRLNNGSRVSVYVYNPRNVRIAATPKLRRTNVAHKSVYVGYIRGYSVALTNKHDVGYAVASDLDEDESSRLVLAVNPQ
jgi:anti-sigma factor RsiW